MSNENIDPRVVMIRELEAMAQRCKAIGDKLVKDIRLGTADEWTAYELIRGAERGLEAAAIWLIRDQAHKEVLR